jgi:hypothetical protein
MAARSQFDDAGPDGPADAAFLWRFDRSLARVEPAVEALVADYATSYCLRPVRRREIRKRAAAGVQWSIDREAVVDLIDEGRGPVLLLVHDIALLRPLRRQLRSRHVRIEYDAPSPSD